jgi:hypothetical protein
MEIQASIPGPLAVNLSCLLTAVKQDNAFVLGTALTMICCFIRKSKFWLTDENDERLFKSYH